MEKDTRNHTNIKENTPFLAYWITISQVPYNCTLSVCPK